MMPITSLLVASTCVEYLTPSRDASAASYCLMETYQESVWKVSTHFCCGEKRSPVGTVYVVEIWIAVLGPMFSLRRLE